MGENVSTLLEDSFVIAMMDTLLLLMADLVSILTSAKQTQKFAVQELVRTWQEATNVSVLMDTQALMTNHATTLMNVRSQICVLREHALILQEVSSVCPDGFELS